MRRLAAILFSTLLPLLATEPPAAPQLRLEVGTHLSQVWQIGADASGRWALTASNDKTLRIWDLQTRSLVQVLRPPVGAGNEGQLRASAISPDARFVVSGGWTSWEWEQANCVYIFERATGRMISRITGLPSVVTCLTFSRDGSRLAVCLHGKSGVRVYAVPTFREIFRDEAYGDQIYGADFDPHGRLATSSWDGKLRLYSPTGLKLREVPAQDGKQPHRISFSPDGSRLAVGFNDAPVVALYSGADLSRLFLPDCGGASYGFPAVAWSLDGSQLMAGGKYALQDELRPIRVWERGGRGSYRELVGDFKDTYLDLRTAPDGSILVASGAGWGRLTAGGRLSGSLNACADFRDRALSMDRSGGEIGFSLGFPNGPLWSFDLEKRHLSEGTLPGLRRAQAERAGLNVRNWAHNYSPSLDDKPLKIEAGEISRALAISPGGRDFILGADWHLYAFDSQGAERWNQAVPGTTWAVAISGDGACGLAGYGDGTLRWFRMSDGQEFLALYVHPTTHQWILWTPSGYYDASPGAEDLIGWHLNRRKDEAADFFPVSRFRSAYYRPDVIDQVLETLDEGSALRAADARSGGRPQAVSIQEMLPPVVQILSPETGSRVGASTVTVRASVRHPKGLPIDEVWASVDGRQVGERGIQVQPAADGTRSLSVAIPPRDCMVSVFARSGGLISEAATVRLVWGGGSPAASQDGFLAKPKLYVLAVGVGRYAQADLNLQYPAKDARDVAAAFAAQKGHMYRDVETRVLTDEQATKGDILDGLEWIQRATTSRDMAVVFLAGHGVNDPQGQFFFLPHQADLERMRRTMVADSEVKDVLSKVPGKVLLFLDSCHSGNVMGKVSYRGAQDVNRFVSELASAENGVVVFTASTGRQASQESPAWGNGAFTKALLEGLSGRADFTKKGAVTVNMLDLYLSERVKELTRGTQSPVTVKPSAVPDFPIVTMESGR
nr:caspase family protein [uncultured Holophaga sp.]